MSAQSAVEMLALLRRIAGGGEVVVSAPLVEGSLTAAHLQLDVEGVGPLSQPASANELANLAARCQPAPFGLGTRTLVDVSVRDTGELDAAAWSLRWAAGVEAGLCAEIARGLGLPQVELKPHKLLCYGKGQFFKPHRDTARQAGMVGTLVLIWPAAHIGGTLKLSHRRRVHRFESQQLAEEGAIRWCAFYADCRHEVLPVSVGHRLALSFEVLLPVAQQTSASQSPSADPQLSAALGGVFAAASPDEPPRLRPWCLLLDHQYNQHTLRWSSLKGRDRRVATALRAAALANGYTIELALLEQTDIWDCSAQAGSQFDDWDGDDELDEDDATDDATAPDFDPHTAAETNLIDRSCTINGWVGPDDQIAEGRQSMQVSSGDLVSLRPTGQVHLVDKEYEGYMGNYGETMSYWYRRAVLVVQSPRVALRLRYQTHLPQALRELVQRGADPALKASIGAEVQAVADILAQGVRQKSQELLPALLEVGALLTADAAADLLAPLHHAALGVGDVAALRRLEQTHGTAWLGTQLRQWIGPRDFYWRAQPVPGVEPDHAPSWPEPLDQFIRSAAHQGLAPAVLAAWQAALLELFLKDEASWKTASPRQREDLLERRLRWLERLLRALCVPTEAAAVPLLERAIQTLRSSTRGYPLLARARLLACVMAAPHVDAQRPVIADWCGQLTAAIDDTLALPVRAADDHGLRGVEWVCRCTLCIEVITWAESASGGLFRIAVAEAQRQHISTSLHAAAVPIRTETLKQGRPYSLICHKQGGLAERDQAVRQHLVLARVRLQALAEGVRHEA